jgi:putative transposase
MRNISLVDNELYHVYNRGVDKRSLFEHKDELDRFFESMVTLNTVSPTGHLDRNRNPVSTDLPLVSFIAYGINPNHFHFILEQVSEKGIERFMHKLGVSHAKYFNLKHQRTGALFESRFKAKHIDSNEYLLHLSAYINLNNKAHGRGNASALSKTSWEEYTEDVPGICNTKILLEQFKNKTEYQAFAEDALEHIINRKILLEGIDLSKPGFDISL